VLRGARLLKAGPCRRATSFSGDVFFRNRLAGIRSLLVIDGRVFGLVSGVGSTPKASR
jgi:hypothetical protein